MNKGQQEAYQLFQKWNQSDCIIVEVAGTALTESSEVLEISLVNLSGEVIFHSFVKPKGRISAKATELHGIQRTIVKDAPTFPEVWERIQPFLEQKTILMSNAEQTLRFIQNGFLKWEDATGESISTTLEVYSVMDVYADLVGSKKRVKIDSVVEGSYDYRATSGALAILSLLQKCIDPQFLDSLAPKKKAKTKKSSSKLSSKKNEETKSEQKVEEQVEEEVTVQAEEPVEEEVTVQAEEQVEEEVTVQAEEPVEEEVTVQAEEPVEEEVTVQAEEPVEEEVIVQAEGPVEEEVTVQAEEPAEEEVTVQAEEPVEEEVIVQAEESVEEEVVFKGELSSKEVQPTTNPKEMSFHRKLVHIHQETTSKPSLQQKIKKWWRKFHQLFQRNKVK